MDRSDRADKLWEYATFKNRQTDQTLYSPRLVQSDVQLFESAQPMDRDIWNKFAMLVGCFPAIIEKVDWLHPLHGYWLRRGYSGYRVRRRWPKYSTSNSTREDMSGQGAWTSDRLRERLRLDYQNAPSSLTASFLQRSLIGTANALITQENTSAAEPFIVEALTIAEEFGQDIDMVVRGLVLALAFIDSEPEKQEVESVIKSVRGLWDGNPAAAKETVMTLVSSLQTQPPSVSDIIRSIGSLNRLSLMFPDDPTVATTIDVINELLQSAKNAHKE
jgi:hypothetical protein